MISERGTYLVKKTNDIFSYVLLVGKFIFYISERNGNCADYIVERRDYQERSSEKIYVLDCKNEYIRYAEEGSKKKRRNLFCC